VLLIETKIKYAYVQYTSQYEGDLVAKCYYAKQKLVWEVLHCGLKSKIELQWSDITALKATCPEAGDYGTLDIVVRSSDFVALCSCTCIYLFH
jgi:hypothetical protein